MEIIDYYEACDSFSVGEVINYLDELEAIKIRGEVSHLEFSRQRELIEARYPIVDVNVRLIEIEEILTVTNANIKVFNEVMLYHEDMVSETPTTFMTNQEIWLN